MAKSPVFDRLRELRRLEQDHQPRFTVTWLAQRLEVDRTVIYRWLSGAEGWALPDKRRRQIAALLDMSVEDVRPGQKEVAV